MNTSELTGAALDWAVAKLEFPEPDYCSEDWLVYITEGCSDEGWVFNPSENWAQGGPIIEREGVCVKKHPNWWTAYIENDNLAQGPTPLVAAMRCYVASKLGEEVDVPKELI